MEKFKHLEENLKVLNEIKRDIEQSNNRGKRVEWEVRYGLFESIQIVIDISCKISSVYNLGNPQSYKECVELLEKFNYLDEKLAKSIKGTSNNPMHSQHHKLESRQGTHLKD